MSHIGSFRFPWNIIVRCCVGKLRRGQGTIADLFRFSEPSVNCEAAELPKPIPLSIHITCLLVFGLERRTMVDWRKTGEKICGKRTLLSEAKEGGLNAEFTS